MNELECRCGYIPVVRSYSIPKFTWDYDSRGMDTFSQPRYSVKCYECGMTTNYYDSEHEAISAWNHGRYEKQMTDVRR